jgi:transposase
MNSTKNRIWRTVAEKRRIVDLTLQPGMSVAQVAQDEGVNSNQVFQWRRAHREGTLREADTRSPTLLPVLVQEHGTQSERSLDSSGTQDAPSTHDAASAIQIELPGQLRIVVERGTDLDLLRAVIGSLRR